MDTSPTSPAQTPDTLAAQLRDLERQGGGMARLAHVAAGALLVAFSAGSLLSISHAAFVAFLAAWQAGHADIPDGISLVVNLLLVLAADIALLYAASVLRVLIAAQAPKSERRVHTWAMVGASALESSTYLYLAWQFDRPTTAFLWALVLARALAAPLFAAYLSMARPLPVAPRDVAYQAALASGKGVVRDVATLAADASAPLRRKVRIYTASALMSGHDRARFNDIIEAVALEDAPAPASAAPALEDAPTAPAQPAPPSGPDTGPQRPPTGPGSPAALAPIGGPSREQIAAAEQLAETWRGWPPERQTARRTATRPAASAAGVRTPRASSARRSQPAERRSNKSGPARSGQSLEGEARLAWASGARTVNTMMALGGMSRNAASGWVRTLKAEASQVELGRQAEREQADAGQLAQ